MSHWRFSLSLKLIVCLIGSLIVIFAVLGYRNVELHGRHLEVMTINSANNIADTIRSSTRYSMLKNHRETIYHIIKTIGAESGINKVRLLNREGRINFSSDESEVGKLLNKDSEACYTCHAQEQPLTKLNRPDRVRIYTVSSGERILGLINPVENEPSCYNASCHAHTAEQKVLGVLDVTMSLASVDKIIFQGRRALVLNLVMAVLIISLIFGGLIWRMVHYRVNKLFVGTQHVAAGDLDYKIKVSAKDELGQLAASFNLMTDELKRAKDQITDWAKTLESRVEEKTHELRTAHEQMIQVERMASMGKLAAIVAHEINNPLTGILASARLLLKRLQGGTNDGDNEQAREHLELIATESSRCGEIVKSLLQFTRQTKGEYVPCDLTGVVSDSLRLVQHKIDLMRVQVRAELAGKIPPVLCDPQEIKQALVAVLINACEAIVEGEGILEVGTRYRPEQRVVEVWVRDNGIGMDEQTRQQIFEPFFTTKEEGRSVGLGMAVVNGIVSRHSGRIEVTSAVGRGTTVVIEFPASLEGRVATTQ